jgi:hypothetical protein
MSTQYPVKDMLLPRSFVYATNSETLVLQSSTAESRIRFVNSFSTTTNYSLATSNDIFRISKDANLIASFNYVQSKTVITMASGGKLQASVFEASAASAQKAFVLYDANQLSSNQFSGIGYATGRVQYQGASLNDVHAFQVARDAQSSAELVRIQSTASGTAQVGIGTTTIPQSVTLAVQGATQIQGSLTVTGALNFDRTGIVQLDPATQRIASTSLPQKVLFLNSNNQVDNAYLPQDYRFQFLRAQKSVGIGTRTPLQRFHVNGTSFFSERIGIGTSLPMATIHAVEKFAVIPALRLEHNYGGNILEAYANGSNIFTIYGNASIGIGTTLVRAGNIFQVQGNSDLVGNMSVSNITVHSTVNANTILLQDRQTNRVLMTQQNLLQADNSTSNTMVCDIPFIFNAGISTPSMYGVGATPYIYIRNTGLRVDGDVIMGSQLYAFSDARIKHNVERIPDALDKLDRISGYTYVKQGNIHREAGLLAQEVMEVLPEAVKRLETDDIYAVSYDAVIPLLVQAIRELKDEVHALRHDRR